MSPKCRKFVVTLGSVVSSDAREIFKILEVKYGILYCGLYEVGDKSCMYVHFKNRICQESVRKKIESMGMEIIEITQCKEYTGKMISEHGNIFRVGCPKGKQGAKKRPTTTGTTMINNGTIINNNTTNNITNNNNTIQLINISLNPVGQESIAHITPEFIQNLLAHVKDEKVVFAFGEELYSDISNINFKGNLSAGRFKGVEVNESGKKEWTTLDTDDGVEIIYNNLIHKNKEAVDSCKGSIHIPDEDLRTFDVNLKHLRLDQHSKFEENEIRHKKFRNKGIKPLMDNARTRFKKFKADHKSDGESVVVDVEK